MEVTAMSSDPLSTEQQLIEQMRSSRKAYDDLNRLWDRLLGDAYSSPDGFRRTELLQAAHKTGEEVAIALTRYQKAVRDLMEFYTSRRSVPRP